MTRTIRQIAISAAAFLAFAGIARAQQTSFDAFAREYLAPLRARNTPVLFAQCRIPPGLVTADPGNVGKFVLISPLGSFTGTLAEFWRDGGSVDSEWKLVNIADKIELAPKVSVGELGNGGVYTNFVFREEAKFLLSQPLSFLRPKDFETVAAIDPTVSCADVEFDPRSPTGLPPSKEQEPLILVVSIKHIDLAPDEKITQLHFAFGCVDLVAISGLPRDWSLAQDNKTNCETSVTGHSIHGAGGLDEKEIRTLEFRITPHYSEVSSVAGYVSVTKDFVNERRVDLTSSNFHESMDP